MPLLDKTQRFSLGQGDEAVAVLTRIGISVPAAEKCLEKLLPIFGKHFRNGPKISLLPVKAGNDPSITIYEVELEQAGKIWRETFGSEESLNSFVLGLRAAIGVAGGYLEMPTIPQG
jgi:hypothetical protein